MSNSPGNSMTDAAVDDAAAGWLGEQADGFTPERAREFAAWRDADPRHAAAIARVERTLALLDELPGVRAPLEARFGPTDEIGASVQPRARSAGVRAWMLGLAAVLVVGFAAWWVIDARRMGEESFLADAGNPRRITLRDGSVVDLNAGGDLRVRFAGDRRDVTLRAGEAHFQVVHDAARPFVVSAGGVAVRAIGTAFNVRLAANAVDVLVVEGKVEVALTAAAPAETAVSVVPPPRIEAGERATVSRTTPAAVPQVGRAEPAEIRATLAWQNPVTTFTDVPLRDVVSQFNRRNVRQLVLAEAELGERRIGGVIALDQVEAFVRLLEQDGDVATEQRGEHEIVLRRAR